MTQAEIIAPHMALREDLGLFAAGETMLEAVDKVAEEHERNVRLFLLLLAGLRALDRRRRPGRRGRVVPAEAAVAVRVPSVAHGVRGLRRGRTRSCSPPGRAARSVPHDCAEDGAGRRSRRAALDSPASSWRP